MTGVMNRKNQLEEFERTLRDTISNIDKSVPPLQRMEKVGEPYDSLVMATREIKQLRQSVNDLASMLIDAVNLMKGGIKNESAPKC